MTANATRLGRLVGELSSWDGHATDPWEKEPPFELIGDSPFPDQAGVYAFINAKKRTLYYIGKAEKSLAGRLDRKLRADVRDPRCIVRQLEDGKLNHEHPYLLEYQCYETKVYYVAVSDPGGVESALLASYHDSTDALVGSALSLDRHAKRRRMLGLWNRSNLAPRL